MAAESACLATKKVIPYSPYSQLEAHCDGKRLEVTALFGRNLEQKFRAHLKGHGLKVIGHIGEKMIVSKNTREELGVNEFCSVVKVSYLKEFSFDCEDSIGWSIKTTKDNDLRRYLLDHKFKILNTDPYVLGR